MLYTLIFYRCYYIIFKEKKRNEKENGGINMSFIVAIDGPAGSGKGTVTKKVEERMGLISIDTGAMYRCVTLYMLRNNIGLDEISKIEEMLNKIDINLTKEDGIVIVDHHNEDASTIETDSKLILPEKSSASEIMYDLLKQFQIKPDCFLANYLLYIYDILIKWGK